MSDISLSKAVRSNLLSLQNTASMMAKTQERLATGNKVNSALDNPTNYFTAASLNSRAGDINQLLDGMANGIQTIKAADNGLSAITKTLESMQSTLRQARQDKSFKTESFSFDPTSIDTADVKNLTFSGGSITGSVNVALNTADAAPTVSTAVGTGFTAPSAGTAPDDLIGTAPTALNDNASMTFSVNGVDVSITNSSGANYDAGETVAALAAQIEDLRDNGTAAQQAALADIVVDTTGDVLTLSNATEGSSITVAGADAALAGFAVGNRTSAGDAPESFTVTVAGREVVLNSTNASDATTAAATINSAISADGFSAEEDGGFIRINGPADGSANVTITGSTAALNAIFGANTAPTVTPGATGEGTVRSVNDLVTAINGNADLRGNIRASNDNGKLRIENLSTTDLDIAGIGAENAIDGTTATPVEVGGNTTRSDLAAQFRDLRDQLDKLADDASFNGINLLRGDNLQITFNETSTSELNIRSKDEQGISSAILGLNTNLQASDLDRDSNIDTLIAGVKTAINTVRSQASAFGSSLSVVQNRQDFSKNMINTLQTGAANLTLADMNEEAANLLALQTRQSLSSSALSMASQADQSVLQLLR
ncbi:flagellin [Devosia chinhatensis]|uniref:flagellin N-terminal helical domain-containing protein n=1 Tax=Devosia chinhatensis TaxID=429727 RepID=UPI000697152C|nr:flagellin [Devosia chinhatensis]